MRLYWIRMSPKPNDFVFMGRGEDTHWEEGYEGLEAKVGVMHGVPGAIGS